MQQLEAIYTPAFRRDVKRLIKKHYDKESLSKVIDLILEGAADARKILIQRHNMHTLSGSWKGSRECHVCNAGDWLLVWREHGSIAYLQRTGKHDEIFG